jgi:hypothetical protein
MAQTLIVLAVLLAVWVASGWRRRSDAPGTDRFVPRGLQCCASHPYRHEGTSMPQSSAPDGASHPDAPSPRQALHVNAWNLLLLVPLLMLITPVFNQDSPRLFGMPFFYWYQFAWVPVGVICVALVYLKTRDKQGATKHD